MKKRMLTMMIGAVGVIVVALAGWYVMFVHFGKGPAFPFVKVYAADIVDFEQTEIADNPLMALTETEEEAQGIAEQYGIDLVSFENGLALYQTNEDPFEVIARGEKNGYTKLSINFIRSAYDGDQIQRIYGE
ncbi:MAG: hypothetical protein HDR07_08020 [Lachnospiraceae bacterium]|nr:hypothetical protein [Lachnospiraceae bacterium]